MVIFVAEEAAGDVGLVPDFPLGEKVDCEFGLFLMRSFDSPMSVGRRKGWGLGLVLSLTCLVRSLVRMDHLLESRQ